MAYPDEPPRQIPGPYPPPPVWPQSYGPPPGPSDKSRVVAGLLQILPGVLLMIGGIGRLYAGHTRSGATQLAASMVCWILLACGWWTVAPFFLAAVMWVCFLVDGVILMTTQSVDGQGRPMI